MNFLGGFIVLLLTAFVKTLEGGSKFIHPPSTPCVYPCKQSFKVALAFSRKLTPTYFLNPQIQGNSGRGSGLQFVRRRRTETSSDATPANGKPQNYRFVSIRQSLIVPLLGIGT